MAGGAGYKQASPVTLSLPEYDKKGLATKELMKRLKWASQGSTIRLVSNCEAVVDWDIEDAAQLNAVDDTTDKLTGSTSMELVDVGTTVGTTVTMDDDHRPQDDDWSDFYWVCLWVHDDTAARAAGELTIQIRNQGTWGTEIAVPVVSNVDCWECKAIYIGGEDRSNVDGFRFVNQRGTGSDEKVYIDRIVVTDIVAGEGNGATVGTGPVVGPIRAVQMATGQTIRPGNAVNLEAGVAHAGAADDTMLIGIACEEEQSTTGPTASDTAEKEIFVAMPGAVVWLRTDGSGAASGDACSLGTAGLIITSMITTVEKSFCRDMDGSTANFDNQFMLGVMYADN